MEVMVQSSSAYLSAPSSPKRLGEYYLSAPTSPSRLSELYSEIEYYSTTINNVKGDDGDGDDDDGGFAFFVSGESANSSRSAEELFFGGKIKPLKPEVGDEELFTSQKSTIVSKLQHNKTKSPVEDFSSKKVSNFGDPSDSTSHRRGRDRTPQDFLLSSSKSGRRVTRSHSPYRESHYNWEEEHQQQQQKRQQPPRSSNKEDSTLTSSSSNSKGSSRRWRLKDLLLFRSASEGRGSSKDVLKSILYRKHEEANKTSSFRSSDSSSTPKSRKKGHVSAHEFHYAMKRAESEDMKKKTFLPYKQGILGRLAGFGI